MVSARQRDVARKRASILTRLHLALGLSVCIVDIIRSAAVEHTFLHLNF